MGEMLIFYCGGVFASLAIAFDSLLRKGGSDYPLYVGLFWNTFAAMIWPLALVDAVLRMLTGKGFLPDNRE